MSALALEYFQSPLSRAILPRKCRCVRDINPTRHHARKMLLNLDEDDIDDLLYLARTNDVKDLQASIGKLPQSHNVSSEDIITSIIDPVNGNSLLHMASANGCIGSTPFHVSARQRERLGPDLPSSGPTFPSSFLSRIRDIAPRHKSSKQLRQYSTALGRP